MLFKSKKKALITYDLTSDFPIKLDGHSSMERIQFLNSLVHNVENDLRESDHVNYLTNKSLLYQEFHTVTRLDFHSNAKNISLIVRRPIVYVFMSFLKLFLPRSSC